MATHIKDLIVDFIKDKENNCHASRQVKEILDATLGVDISNYLEVKELSGKVLVLSSPASSVSYVLRLKHESLLKNLQESFPELKHIKIEVI